MMESPQMEKRILKVLKNNSKTRGLSLEELSRKTGLCRGTISKHIGILEAKNNVTVEKVGNLRLVSFYKSPHEKRGREQ